MQQTQIVEIRNVSFGYDPARPVLRDIDLAIPRGAVVGIMGQSGCGKTTLIKCILDLVACDGGAIDIFGIAAQNPAARRRLAYLPERFNPPHYLRGREFLSMMGELAGERYDEAPALRLFEELQLESGVLGQPVRTLSKGMTQKLGLAACLLLPRDLYLLDEPMSGLDPAARVAVKSVLRRLAAEGRTLFFTSHVLADVDELCTSIAVLDRGRVRWRGTPAALRTRYGEASLETAFMRCVRDDESAISA
ncbi:MAG TPA: ABC transporter ATP-binding protein [Burkholderiales bacterium]|nr:ABC transporter ATP-binding protein [Burkholderiales bacterium]